MTCLIAPLPGGSPEIFPQPIDQIDQLRAAGQKHAQVSGIYGGKPEVQEFLGAARRADGTPFYLWVCAPTLEDGKLHPWKGAFFAPFGVGDVRGTLDVRPGLETEDPFAITEVDVAAELVVREEEHVAVSWRLIGSQLSVANKSALIREIVVRNAGPHQSDDIRRCIALHAPQRALGEPRALVSMQCGVAVACLLEALC